MTKIKLLKQGAILIGLLIFAAGCKKTVTATVNDIEKISMTESVDTSENVLSKLTNDSTSRTEFYYNYSGNFRDLQKGWQGCPTIGYENGHLYVAYYIGAKGEEPGNYISVSTSNDLGLTWNQNSLIIAYKNVNGRVFDPCFWSEKNGKLHISWTSSENMYDGSKGGVWTSKLALDKVQNIQITKPKRLFNGNMNVKPTHVLSDSSKLIFPVSGWNITSNMFGTYPCDPTIPEFNGAFLYSSEYDKKTKMLTSPIKNIKLPTIFSRTFDEHMLVELSNNEYICMLRTNDNGIATMKSADGGTTWSSETKFSELGPTTTSRFYFGKLKSGNLLFVFNNSTQREKLTAFLSTDKGKSWPYKVLIDSRLGTSYPDVVQNSNNEICLTYDWGRGYPNGYIYFTKFTESDIITGDATKIIKTVVTKLIP